MKSKATAFVAVLCVSLSLANASLQAAEKSAEKLLAEMQSSTESVRLDAIDDLPTVERPDQYVGLLTALLKDPSAHVRAHAASALGAIGAAAKPAMPALTELLKDRDAEVRQQAVHAVLRIKPGPQIMVPLCVSLLEDADPGVRLRVLHAIAEAGPAAVPGLTAALNNDKAAYWACLALREIGPGAKEAVPALMKKLQDARPEIRREAILALAAMDSEAAAAAEAITTGLEDQHTQTAATYALGRIGKIPADAEARIREGAKSSDAMLSTTSLWALARVHPDDKALRVETAERLIARLKDADPMVRMAAARALGALPPAPEITAPIWEKELGDADETTVRNALDAVATLGPLAVAPLTKALKHEKLRGHIAYALGQIGPAAAPATPSLAKLVNDKSERVAHEAVLALANIGPAAKEAVPTLIKALQQPENANAAAIAYALGKIGPDSASAVPALTGLLDSADRNVGIASAWALVQILPASPETAAKTVPVLVAGLSSPLPVARRGAAEALGGLGRLAQSALPALQQASGDADVGVRQAIIEAMARIRGK